ncbi:hypothetical protein FGE12_11685 [Aggregicoccus sp. 17bor-14]|uniref:hypothetical protein n=1 Tax=Myxococcaceae TaxID=31 RepID=UPI00129C6189|nr:MULTISPECIES: hypothetical protein [Myxococcaceae]MBF5043049.1 hypothetical protein [Simulacricoccus sp. 17bor-14]MRI88812.1 hypothetical protein [Aggregicoccus sp. 17bor-14]
MTQSTEDRGERVADFTLPEGCVLCGGAVDIRATPAGAHSYCPTCHHLSKPQLRMKKDSLELIYATDALA